MLDIENPAVNPDLGDEYIDLNYKPLAYSSCSFV